MKFHVTVNIEASPTVLAKLDGLLAALNHLSSRITAMGQKTDAAVAALTAEVADSTTKLEGLRLAVIGFPDVVAAAVADALAQAGVSDEAAAGAIDGARTAISDKVDEVFDAANLNTPPEEPPVTSEPAPPADGQ